MYVEQPQSCFAKRGDKLKNKTKPNQTSYGLNLNKHPRPGIVKLMSILSNMDFSEAKLSQPCT